MGSRWSDMNNLRKAAVKHGCKVVLLGSGHYKVTSPDGTQHTVLANTPGTSGTHIADRRRLKKMGMIP